MIGNLQKLLKFCDILIFISRFSSQHIGTSFSSFPIKAPCLLFFSFIFREITHILSCSQTTNRSKKVRYFFLFIYNSSKKWKRANKIQREGIPQLFVFLFFVSFLGLFASQRQACSGSLDPDFASLPYCLPRKKSLCPHIQQAYIFR